MVGDGDEANLDRVIREGLPEEVASELDETAIPSTYLITQKKAWKAVYGTVHQLPPERNGIQV